MTLYARQQKDIDVKNKLLDFVGEGEGGMIWENSTETCILAYVKHMSSASLMHEAGHSKLVLWNNPKGLKGCCWPMKRLRDSWPPEENSIRGQRRGLIAQSFCVIEFYYRRDRESFWHRHQKGAEKVLPTLVLAMELYTFNQLLQWIKRMSGGCKESC